MIRFTDNKNTYIVYLLFNLLILCAGTMFGCLAADKILELWRLHDAKEIKKKQKKRQKRIKLKKQKTSATDNNEMDIEDSNGPSPTLYFHFFFLLTKNLQLKTNFF